MIGLATFLNPLMRIVVIVATLAAVYFFLVKPVLDRTDEQFDRLGIPNMSELPAEIQKTIRSAEQQVDGTGTTTTKQQRREQRRAQKLIDCIQKADGDVVRIQRCTQRFG